MRSLLFCTAYAGSYDVWQARYRRWIDSVRSGALAYDQILIIDDCSPVLPNWPGMEIMRADGATLSASRLALASFDHHLGAGKGHGNLDYQGWYRSFCYAAKYAGLGKFDRIIHIESDTHVISSRLQAYLNGISDGWVTLWCPLHSFPEDNIQIVAGEALHQFMSFARRPYTALQREVMETQYPFTKIETAFVGDRYGEFRDDVPRNADFAAQTRHEAGDAYFWWLGISPDTSAGQSRPNGRRVPDLCGHIDLISVARIDGWACDLTDLSASLHLSVYSRGEFLGETIADRYREDVHKAGIGSGAYGFTFAVPPGHRMDPPHIQVRVAGYGSAR